MRQQGAAADAEAGRFLNPNLIQHVDDERDRDEVLRAAALVSNGDVDIDRLLQVYDTVRSPLRGILLEMGRAEPRADGDKGHYYGLLAEEMQKLDKEGTPYISPDSVAHIVTLMSEWSSDEMRDAVDWYRQDTLPLAAFDVVNAVRERVVKTGVPDNPTSIYEYFCHSPELISDMSRVHLDQYVSGQLELTQGYHKNYEVAQFVSDKDPHVVISKAKEMAQERAQYFRVFVNLKRDALVAAVQQGGAIKSIMDTDVVDYDAMEDRGASYVFHRSNVELMTGNRSRGESDHPIYGSCGFVDRGIRTGAVGYGDIMLSFKPSEGDIASRTRYTPEDSFLEPIVLLRSMQQH